MKNTDKFTASLEKPSPVSIGSDEAERPLWLVRWPLCEMTVEVRLMPCNTSRMDSDGWHEFDSINWLHRVWVRLVRRESSEIDNLAATIAIAAHEFEHVATASVKTMRVRPTSAGAHNELRAYIIQSLTKLFSCKLCEWRGVQVGANYRCSKRTHM